MKKSQVQDEFIRKRMERQRRIRKRRLLISFFVFLFLLFCTGIVLSFTVFFPIEKLTVEGSAVYTQEQVLSVADIKKGDNIFAISKKSVLNKLKKELPYVEELEFKRELPSTLKIKIHDAEDFAMYVKKDIYYTVSESGWILCKNIEPSQNLFEIRGASVDCKVGTQIKFKKSEEEQLIKEITESLNQNELKINYIDISSKISLQVGVQDRFTVNIGTSNYLEEKVRHLTGMIKNIPEEKSGKIDLSMWTTDNTQGTFKAENAE